MDEILSTIGSPHDLKELSQQQLNQLASEMREALCRLLGTRSAHFASNLGVIELSLALHSTFDFSQDRLIWDTGHQIYPHKMLTGRYKQFGTIRTKGGLMGYPNPAESIYDLFMTGHAGCSVATILGLKCGDDLQFPEEDRHAVAVIGDGAFPCGVVLEAMNNAGGLNKNLTVVLNDNRMSICPRVGGMADYLDRLRLNHFYTGMKAEIRKYLDHVPLIGDPVERFFVHTKNALKAGLLGGMLFEDLGFHYIGPVDGHNIAQVQKYLRMARKYDGPVVVHAVTEKGHGFEPAAEDPTGFHAPAPFKHENGSIVKLKSSSAPSVVSYTQLTRDALLEQMHADEKTVVITAAMCQGNMLEPIREQMPDRFFDVGICESHAVAFAAGLAKSGVRPAVAIYSTFMQRSYDQIFQEVSLQDLPVVLLLDRAGLTGPDGPTHHGMFDIGYLRPLPNLTIMAPGDALDVKPMLQFAMQHDGPTAIRYPKSPAPEIERETTPIELGRAETVRPGKDGTLVAYGAPLPACVEAAEELAQAGIEVGVINARFVKPLDTETLLHAVEHSPFVVTVEEGMLAGGFGSALVEAAVDAGLDTRVIHRVGAPDSFVQHGTRDELLAEIGLDSDSLVETCRQLANSGVVPR